MGSDILRLVESGSSEDSLEACIRHGMMTIQIEVEDRREGHTVRTLFVPNRAQAESLGLMLLKWAKA